MPGIKRQVEGQIDKVSNMEEAQTEERTEQLIEQAYTYLKEKAYSDGCSDTRKRVIRKKAAIFEVKDGELYYIQVIHKGRGNWLTISIAALFADNNSNVYLL